jgi:hypothetical protein
LIVSVVPALFTPLPLPVLSAEPALLLLLLQLNNAITAINKRFLMLLIYDPGDNYFASDTQR